MAPRSERIALISDVHGNLTALGGVIDSPVPAPFSLAFVRVPYDVDAELAHAREVGAPEDADYESEVRCGIYRGSMTEYADGASLDTYYHDVLVR